MLTKNYFSVLGGFITNAPFALKDHSGTQRWAAYSIANNQNPYAISLQYGQTLIPTSSTSLSSNYNGLMFGSGSAEPTMDDYTIEAVTGLNITYVKTYEAVDDSGSSTVVYTVSNTNSEEVTISEVGLFSRLYARSSATATGVSTYGTFLLERTVLDEPVTIPAGGVAQITYTISMTIPAE